MSQGENKYRDHQLEEVYKAETEFELLQLIATHLVHIRFK